MISDRTIYQALPGLLDAYPAPIARRPAAITLPQWQDTPGAGCGSRQPLQAGRVPWDRGVPDSGLRFPCICSDDFLTACAALADAVICACKKAHLAGKRGIAAGGPPQQRYGHEPDRHHLTGLGLPISSLFSGRAMAYGCRRTRRGGWLQQGQGSCTTPLSNLRSGSFFFR